MRVIISVHEIIERFRLPEGCEIEIEFDNKRRGNIPAPVERKVKPLPPRPSYGDPAPKQSKRITPDVQRNINKDLQRGDRVLDIAARYDVSVPTVYNIKKHLDEMRGSDMGKIEDDAE